MKTLEQVATLLRKLEDAFEAETLAAHAWSTSPESDIGTAIWGECIMQVNGWLFRRSGNVVFKLGAAKTTPKTDWASKVLRFSVVGVDIVIGSETWELGRDSRHVFRENVFRPGPWWDYVETLARDIALRIDAQRNRCVIARQKEADAAIAFEINLRNEWKP